MQSSFSVLLRFSFLLSLSLYLPVFRSTWRWPQTPEQTEFIQGRSVRRDKWWFIMEMCCKCPCAATVFQWEASVESRGPERLMSSRRDVWQEIKITINFTTCVPLKRARKRTEWIRIRWDEMKRVQKTKRESDAIGVIFVLDVSHKPTLIISTRTALSIQNDNKHWWSHRHVRTALSFGVCKSSELKQGCTGDFNHEYFKVTIMRGKHIKDAKMHVHVCKTASSVLLLINN